MALAPAGLTARSAPESVAPVLTRAERRRRERPRPAEALMPVGVAVATLVLRLLTAATGPTDWDSAQYASAVAHYDVAHGQPQPPGYWLYVVSGRFLHVVIGMGSVAGLVLVAAVASAAAAGMTALAGKDLGGWWVGLAAGVFVALSPFAWFSGSTVSTYSFDMLACSTLLVLAWRARPGSWHGIGAAVVLGLLAGFRQSILQSFALLALIAVVASTRRWTRLAVTALAGAASVGIWLVPMGLEQTGGLAAWVRATRQEAVGAAHLTSVLDHAPGGGTNLGTFAAATVVALAPLAAVALGGVALLLVRRLASGSGHRVEPGVDPAPVPVQVAGGNLIELPRWTRPWYQGRPAVLTAAVLPPVLLVSLVQFAKGGYLLAYLPAAAIALLLPLGALVRRRDDPRALSRSGLALASAALIAVVALGAQRFLAGNGVLPASWVRQAGSLWLVQPRYQAPYPDTLAAIRGADRIDAALRPLGGIVRPGRDVVAFDGLDGGANLYRDAGWALPGARVSFFNPGSVVYNEHDGALFYASGHTVAVGPGGSMLLVASPALPGLAGLTASGTVQRVVTPQPIGGYLVWRVPPGTTILGITVVRSTGPRPLGSGL